jgi:hypothetical protein
VEQNRSKDEIIFKGFYPTPKKLIDKMVSKIQGHPTAILEPSAGKGDIIEGMVGQYYESHFDRFRLPMFSAIEIDEDLQAILRDKGIKVIDSDFLSYSGPDKFDLIIANPPFETGDLHLLKAIDIMYRGEIIFLVNSETIKNPYTNMRKALTLKLKELQADIEYIPGAFKNAERPTGVEVALVYIRIERSVEDDLFKGADNKVEAQAPEIDRNYEVSTKQTISELVAEYKQIIRLGTETILGYYRNYRKVGKYIGLNDKPDHYHGAGTDMTSLMQSTLNSLLVSVRTDFWRRTLDIPEVRKRMTSKKANEFEEQLKKRCDLDFTESNIRQFIINLIGSYEKTLTEAVVDIFDKFTVRHCYSGGLYDDNIHYFNGWKTNKAFKVNKKVIIPVYGGYGDGPFTDSFSKKWKLYYGISAELHDIDIVMNYFDGMDDYYSIGAAIENAFQCGQSNKIHSTYFTITCYKKGTIHLTFNSEDILRRFNVAACMGKVWLPHDYGKKAYQQMPEEERAIVDSFEGAPSYNVNLNRPLFAVRNSLQLTGAGNEAKQASLF